MSDAVPPAWYLYHTMLGHSYDSQCRCPDCCGHERAVASCIRSEERDRREKSGVRHKKPREILMSGSSDANPNAW